jgi:hypothetical protein
MFRKTAGVVAVTAAAIVTLAGCSLFGGKGESLPVPSSTRTPHATSTGTAAGHDAAGDAVTPTPTKHLATPEPVSTPVPEPVISAIPQGTVLAQGDVASPKGSIHFHFRMLADGKGQYVAEYSSYRSTLPVPVGVTLIDIPPHVGDGITDHGVGDHQLGGPTTGVAPTTSQSFSTVGRPSYLGSLVVYSDATDGADLPVEIGPGKILAVNSVSWTIPAQQTNVHPVDKGSQPFALGVVTSKTTAGAPGRYLVAHGDLAANVAARFGISVTDLIWLNQGLQVLGDDQQLYENTRLNLDPANR